MAIEIEELKKGVIGFKMASYSDWCPYTNLTTANDSGEWAGLYVSLNKQVAEGYGTDYLDLNSGNGDAFMHVVHLLQQVKLIVCDDRTLGDGGVKGDAKADLVRAQLPKTIVLKDGPLIPELGRQGYFFKGYHDEDNMELIVPNKLSALVVLMKRVTYTYQRWFAKSQTVHTD